MGVNVHRKSRYVRRERQCSRCGTATRELTEHEDFGGKICDSCYVQVERDNRMKGESYGRAGE